MQVHLHAIKLELQILVYTLRRRAHTSVAKTGRPWFGPPELSLRNTLLILRGHCKGSVFCTLFNKYGDVFFVTQFPNLLRGSFFCCRILVLLALMTLRYVSYSKPKQRSRQTKLCDRVPGSFFCGGSRRPPPLLSLRSPRHLTGLAS